MEYHSKNKLDGSKLTFRLDEAEISVESRDAAAGKVIRDSIDYSLLGSKRKAEVTQKTAGGAYLCGIVGFFILYIGVENNQTLMYELKLPAVYWGIVAVGVGIVLFGLRTIRSVRSHIYSNHEGIPILSISDRGSEPGKFDEFVGALESRIEA